MTDLTDQELSRIAMIAETIVVTRDEPRRWIQPLVERNPGSEAFRVAVNALADWVGPARDRLNQCDVPGRRELLATIAAQLMRGSLPEQRAGRALAGAVEVRLRPRKS